MIGEVLGRAGIEFGVCAGLQDLRDSVPNGAGALLIADEALGPGAITGLATLLSGQPAWSDLPVLVMTSGGEATERSQHRAGLLDPLGNVTLLERPLRIVTLLSAVRSALRARRRQYEICAHLEERERLMVQLADRERLYRGIGESIDFGIWVTSPDGRNLYASESFLKLLGMRQEEYTEHGWRDALHPDEAAGAVSSWKDCIASGCTWDKVLRYRGVDGNWHPVLARGLPIRGETGEVLYWAGINLDTSAVRKADRARVARIQ